MSGDRFLSTPATLVVTLSAGYGAQGVPGGLLNRGIFVEQHLDENSPIRHVGATD